MTSDHLVLGGVAQSNTPLVLVEQGFLSVISEVKTLRKLSLNLLVLYLEVTLCGPGDECTRRKMGYFRKCYNSPPSDGTMTTVVG